MPSVSTRAGQSLSRSLTMALVRFLILTVLTISTAGPALAVDAPVITPSTGVYSTLQTSVTITAEPGATIKYTDDGTTPDTSSPAYSGPIAIGEKAVIKAIAEISPDTSAVATASILSDMHSLPVPRAGLALWLKGEFGPETSGTGGSGVTRWNDLSGVVPANDAVQGNASNQPSLGTGAVNGIDAVKFDGSSRYLNLASGISDLTSGVSIFAVIKPTGTGQATIFTTGNSGPSDMTSLETLSSQVRFNAYSGSTGSSVTSSPASVTQDKFQLMDVVHDGAASAGLAVNTVASGSGAVENLVNITRSQNYVGADTALGSFLNGELAELIVYNRVLAQSERAGVESYLYSRYQLTTATATPPPVFSVASGALSEPAHVALASGADSTIFVTTDGSTPTPASPVYSGPVIVSYSQAIKAIAVANGVTSPVATATYTLDPNKWPAPDPLDTRPINIDLSLPTTAIAQ